MNARDSDRSLDRLLRQPGAYGDRGAANRCPDAETMAAWMDGGLDAAAAVLAESHIADCARCQAVVATMSRAASAETTGVAVSTEGGRPWWRVNLRWMAPLAAGATAAILWMVVPGQHAPMTTTRQSEPAGAFAPAEPPAPQDKPAAPRIEGFAAAVPEAPLKREDARDGAAPEAAGRPADAQASSAPSPRAELAMPVPPPAAARQASSEAAADLAETLVEIPTPDRAIRWRLTSAAVQRTLDGGQSWIAVEVEHAEDLLAGSAPSTTICWLAGRNGIVMLTADASSWRQVSTPSPADLVRVEAVDDTSAVVRTADGRRFRTVDGGATWVAVEAGPAPDARREHPWQ